VRPPSPDEEDRRRLTRERGTLLKEQDKRMRSADQCAGRRERRGDARTAQGYAP
jgi:hypothetical protein